MIRQKFLMLANRGTFRRITGRMRQKKDWLFFESSKFRARPLVSVPCHPSSNSAVSDFPVGWRATCPSGHLMRIALDNLNKENVMNDKENSIRRPARVGGNGLALLAMALALAGCGKPAAKPPEKSLVHTAVVEPADKVRSDGEASYLASVRFDRETDLSFKVGGILVGIGPVPGKDWDQGTPVKAGTVLAELKQADFTNALNSARARAELMVKQLERFRKLRVTDAISQQELDVTEADWRTAQAQLDQAELNLRDSRLVAVKDGVVELGEPVGQAVAPAVVTSADQEI